MAGVGEGSTNEREASSESRTVGMRKGDESGTVPGSGATTAGKKSPQVGTPT